jgi:hypothetical protein
VKWDITDTDHSDVGHVLSRGVIGRIKTGPTSHRWVYITGNGYESTNNRAAPQQKLVSALQRHHKVRGQRERYTIGTKLHGPHGVLWLGGDLISGNIHESLVATNRLGPTAAAIEVQTRLAGGLRYLLDNTDCAWFVPCSVGNHERITQKAQVKTAVENSLAAFVYYGLAAQFADERRITFRLPDAYFTYLDVHGYVCRFHHGDAVKYLGGIGGLHIPLRRKIADWNKAMAPESIDK